MCGLRFPLFSGDARENKQIEQLFRGLMLSKNAKQAPQSQKFGKNSVRYVLFHTNFIYTFQVLYHFLLI